MMANGYKVTPGEIGMIRSYFKPSDKTARRGETLRLGKPLYRELVAQTKRNDIMNAIAHHTHYGFDNHGPFERKCFCAGHGNLLAG